MRVVENCVGGGDKGAREFDLFPCIEIAIEAREIAAGEFEAEPVAGAEDIARRPKVD